MTDDLSEGLHKAKYKGCKSDMENKKALGIASETVLIAIKVMKKGLTKI